MYFLIYSDWVNGFYIIGFIFSRYNIPINFDQNVTAIACYWACPVIIIPASTNLTIEIYYTTT